MPWDHNSERKVPSFWQELGFDEEAALLAANCFPEKHYYDYGGWSPLTEKDHLQTEKSARDVAEIYIGKAPLMYRTDAKHPVFWLTQGYDFDESFKKAVAAIAMVKLQQEANPPPPPPQRDNFAEVVQALLLQGAVQRQLEGPDRGNYQYHDSPQSQERFDPDDYPRFRAKRS